MQCLGTHLEGPLDASTSPVRQQSAAEHWAAAELMYSTREAASVLLRAGAAQPRADKAAAKIPKVLPEIRCGGTPAGACCHCILKACKVCIAWA